MHSEHFSEAELQCHVTLKGVRTPCPDCGGASLCKAMLLFALEELRHIVNRPITLDCAYRCPVHNRAVGGVADSEHVRGEAADIKITGMTPEQMYAAALQVPEFRNGGIGVALHGGYIHVDVRSRHARWCYDTHGKQCAWDPALDAPAMVNA